MAIFLDSTDPMEVRAAVGLGFVAGVTTNPTLIAKTGRPAEQVIASLCAEGPSLVFHQLVSNTLAGLEDEAERFLGLAPGVVALKIPCHADGLRLLARFCRRAACGVTAVYSAAQAYVASEAGAHYVIPYVNRAQRQGVDALALVRLLAEVTVASGKGSEVLAASVKSPEEAAAVLCAGARHVTLPWPVLSKMVEHPFTTLALEEFAAARLSV